MGINRGTVLNLINDVHREGGFKDYNSYSYLFNQVDTMPESKEDTEPHWIPVEQELPEQDQICLVCGKNGGIYVARFWRNESLVLWTKTGTGKFVNAVAWMPLPESYRGNENG